MIRSFHNEPPSKSQSHKQTDEAIPADTPGWSGEDSEEVILSYSHRLLQSEPYRNALECHCL